MGTIFLVLREISIEPPNVGLASLAQLHILEKWLPLRGERAHVLLLHFQSSYSA